MTTAAPTRNKRDRSRTPKKTVLTTNNEQLENLQSLLREQASRIFNPETIEARVKALCFDKQQEFIEDPSRYKVLQCSRRASKSYTLGLALFITCLTEPGSTCFYLSLSKAMCQQIMVGNVFEELSKKLKLKAEYVKTDNTFRLANGSIIYMVGIDSNEQEKNKLRGQRPKLIVIDEAQGLKIDMKELVDSVLAPSLMDYNGSIIMAGTCNNEVQTYFFNACNGKKGLDKQWKVFKWTAADNPYVRANYLAELESKRRINPLIDLVPAFRQEYLNEWVIDSDALCYKFDPEKNTIPLKDFEAIALKEMTYVLGIDFGWSDPTAFVVLGYSKFDKRLFVVESYKQKKMIADDIAKKAIDLREQYNPETIIVDGAAAATIGEIKNRHSIDFELAEKANKHEMIDLAASDFMQQKIFIVQDTCNDALIKELCELTWGVKGTKRIINRKDDHLCDAFLYAWRYSYNYLSEGARGIPFLSRARQGELEEENALELEIIKTIKSQQGFYDSEENYYDSYSTSTDEMFD